MLCSARTRVPTARRAATDGDARAACRAGIPASGPPSFEPGGIDGLDELDEERLAVARAAEPAHHFDQRGQAVFTAEGERFRGSTHEEDQRSDAGTSRTGAAEQRERQRQTFGPGSRNSHRRE